MSRPKNPNLVEHRICVRVMDDDRRNLRTVAALLEAKPGSPGSVSITKAIRVALKMTAEALTAAGAVAGAFG
jgi:hypothetical protein